MSSPDSKKRILIVEDDKDLGRLLSLHLEDLGYAIEHIDNGGIVTERLTRERYDLVILDIMLPEQNGLSICEGVRLQGIGTPLLFLTARGDQEDKLEGFRVGGDDYLSKPFCINELAARVRALLRRQEYNEEISNPKLQFKDLSIDLIRQHVERAGKPIPLTSIEFRLLSFLAQNRSRIVSREELLKEVWGYQTSSYDQTVNTHMNRLRSKIEDNPAEPVVVRTIWGKGYQFGDLEEKNLKSSNHH